MGQRPKTAVTLIKTASCVSHISFGTEWDKKVWDTWDTRDSGDTWDIWDTWDSTKLRYTGMNCIDFLGVR